MKGRRDQYANEPVHYWHRRAWRLTHLRYALTFFASNVGGLFVRTTRTVTAFLSATSPTIVFSPSSFLSRRNGSQSLMREGGNSRNGPVKVPLMVSTSNPRPRLCSRNCAANRF